MSEPSSTAELCDRYSDLYPGAVTDVLDNMEIQDQTLDRDIDPLEPTMQAAGIAYPVVGRPNRSVDPEENIRSMVQMLSEVPEHAVLVYDTNDDSCSHIGELSITALQEADCRGAVVDGGVRDVSYVLDHGFPTFAKYTTPADAVPRWELLDWDVGTVAAGVEVAPGDVVIADVDGVVVVPRDKADEVLLEAESIASTEDDVRRAVRNGTSPVDAYEEFGKF